MSRLHRKFFKKYKSLQESIDLNEYITDAAFSYHIRDEPFKYVVIDNFFKPEFVNILNEKFSQTFSLGLTEDHTERSKFRSFNPQIKYDGYVFTPKLTQDEPFKLFYSVSWNLFFSKMFNKPTTFGTNVAFHHHPKGDKTGWVHSDYSTYVFPQKSSLLNGIHLTSKEDEGENDKKTKTSPEPYLQKRGIALIYYFNNGEWNQGDGGETGLYASKDKASLIEKVAPVNNRLLAFDVSPESYHAFQENLKERNSIVQWFHIDLDWCEDRYGFL